MLKSLSFEALGLPHADLMKDGSRVHTLLPSAAVPGKGPACGSPRGSYWVNAASTLACSSLLSATDYIQQRGGGTATGEALNSMTGVFADTARINVTWYLIVITDGKSSDLVEALRNSGVIIYATGVEIHTELKEIARDKMFFMYESDSLKAIQQEVVQDICSSETCKNRKAYVIFLIDRSKSISPEDFEKMKEFMERMVNQSITGADEIQIGLLQFNSIRNVLHLVVRHIGNRAGSAA
ncbi:LOW QUALITY PROTEIN: collagen alpha-4(VI) chain-like [Ctenodactylus gundi]